MGANERGGISDAAGTLWVPLNVGLELQPRKRGMVVCMDRTSCGCAEVESPPPNQTFVRTDLLASFTHHTLINQRLQYPSDS